MATTMLPAGGIALVGAPDRDLGLNDAKPTPMQAMQVDITQDIVDALLESIKSEKPPQIIFGRTPQLKYGDKTHMLQSSTELHRYELYKSSGTGTDDETLEFAGLINHSLVVHKAEDVTAGVDSALEQLRSNMAAISEFKEANKTIVGDATPGRTPAHRRFPSTGFKASHLAPSSPMGKRPPTSQPTNSHDNIVTALRVPIIHLLAREPATEASLAATCRTSLAVIRDVLPKIAKRSTSDVDKWQLTDKSFREVNPYKFPYKSSEERQQAIDGAVKSFDRQRLSKDDKLWQILLPREERGQGKCLSRSTVKAPEAKPKASTPMQKISDLTKKKPAAKKAADKAIVEKKPRVAKVAEAKPKSSMKEKYLAREQPVVKEVKEEPTIAAAPVTSTSSSSTARPTAPSHRNTPSTDVSKPRTNTTTPRVKPKMSGRDAQRERPANRPFKPTMPVNTKPKNPSPLSASPPVNASDFEDSHPVHKALAAAPSPAKSSGNSDRILKRKANDIDSDIHNHSLAVKKPTADRATPNRTPSHTNGRLNGSTPSSTSSLKRKSDDSSSSNTPTTAPKVRKVTKIDTGLASRYHHNNPRASPGASSSSTTSPSMPSLSFRQTVELSQKFQRYYKKYEELYWQLTEAEKPPTEAQRNDLLKMHKKLEEMKREIKAGAGMHHR
ncbi:hypothetical protein TUN199_08575 [Pyrenophora tritici-repentis]|nr:hypothetical protein Alg130_09820 [Pyrenophora tritici-repentis]KAI0606237.1 hypothetical protein TUN205_09507 [Pyrenophora tritici-repentis]KAI0619430.1 hypothetical protein TUN199_08575 [Pyrenophora tritici-repentis]